VLVRDADAAVLLVDDLDLAVNVWSLARGACRRGI
jgi:hypothetical protein